VWAAAIMVSAMESSKKQEPKRLDEVVADLNQTLEGDLPRVARQLELTAQWLTENAHRLQDRDHPDLGTPGYLPIAISHLIQSAQQIRGAGGQLHLFAVERGTGEETYPSLLGRLQVAQPTQPGLGDDH
jgi:hypothetical protein